MYGGGYIFLEPTKQEIEQHQDDPEKLDAFEKKIDSGEKI